MLRQGCILVLVVVDTTSKITIPLLVRLGMAIFICVLFAIWHHLTQPYKCYCQACSEKNERMTSVKDMMIQSQAMRKNIVSKDKATYLLQHNFHNKVELYLSLFVCLFQVWTFGWASMFNYDGKCQDSEVFSDHNYVYFFLVMYAVAATGSTWFLFYCLRNNKQLVSSLKKVVPDDGP